jgi:A/G-specific adenine glycosylase
MNANKFFSEKLLGWNASSNNRDMPWKHIKNPYHIWLSEIILQQTRVNQGVAYYNNFIKNYPTLEKLALAKEEDVFKIWEGLGYYSRCKNLLFTAKYIHNNLNNIFPQTYNELLKLKGVGPYTAAAIASFAYDEVVPVIDGNVVRVLSRFFGLFDSYETKEGKQLIQKLANELIAKNAPATYNQAIMDFGATVCKPMLPLCEICALSTKCYAQKNNKQSLLPVKKNKLILKERYFNYIVIRHKNNVAIQKRTEKGIWNNLFEFYLVEQPLFDDKLLQKNLKKLMDKEAKEIYMPVIQKLTHQKLHIRFFELETNTKPAGMVWEKINQLKNYAFPITLKKFIDHYVM